MTTNTTLTPEQILARLQEWETESAALKAKSERRLPFKVAEKGAVSWYGLGRWPTTLYPEARLTVVEMGDEIRAFIEENRRELTWRERPGH